MDNMPQAIGIFFSGVIGLVLGSFATMVSYRLPRHEEMVFKRSHCTLCQHPLRVWDLFPCLSWIARKGKCAYCKATISYRYPLVELVMAVLCAICFVSVGWSWQLPLLYLIMLCLVVIAVIDIEYRIIPDSVQVILAILAVVYQYSLGISGMEMLGGAALGLGVGLILRYGYYMIRRREGLGLGDVKFFAIAGIFLSPLAFVLFLFYSGIVGTVIGLLWGAIKKERLFPFAPALCIALSVCILVPYWAVDRVYAILAQLVSFLYFLN